MFGRIRSKFQCLEGEGQNSNVWTDEKRIPMYGRIRARNPKFKRKKKTEF